jgi:ribosomal protein L25 (general stress protein Ctc)
MSPSEIRTETLRRFDGWKLAPNEHLPLLESLQDLKPKSSAQVAARAVVAGYLAAVCFGAPQEKVRLDLERFSLWQHLSTEEQTLVSSPAASEQSKAFHRWLIESIHFMAWSLGLAPLDHFTPCSETLASLLPKAGTDPAQFIASQNLRPIDELLQEADTLYMLHWFAVDANLNGQPNMRVVLPQISFRRHAADWVIGVAEAWDDVSLDT